MATFELDLSKSDSLIDDIQKIFKPPSVETSSNTRLGRGVSKSIHSSLSNDAAMKDTGPGNKLSSEDSDSKSTKVWKKPKANAHEYCDSCSTYEGERLVCDRCPASFHLICLDPPIDNEDAPVGVWYCNRCTALMKEDDDKNLSSSGSSGSKHDSESSNGGGIVKGGKRTCSSDINIESEDVPCKKSKYSGSSSDVTKHLTALENVLEVLQCINPKEFELPKNLIPSIKIPYTFKSANEMKSKSVITMENGMIPQPIVTCFVCSRTCFYGTLVQCDYCPQYYHLDCLDPPLVQLPSRVERWMCPNHIEQVIDSSGMIQTLLLSERMKTYDEVDKKMENVDEIEIINAFSRGLEFRFGSHLKLVRHTNEKSKIKVPEAVKRLYRQPLASVNQTIIDYEKVPLKKEHRSLLKKLLNVTCQNIEVPQNPQHLLSAALESLESLISSNKLGLFAESVTQPASTSAVAKSTIKTKRGGEKIKCRAILIPLHKDGSVNNNEPPVRIIYRNFNIGSSSDCDCVVTGCRYVSGQHASICYIDNHFCFELLNYSRYGTVVDCLVYYNDVSDKEVHRSGSNMSSSNTGLISDLRSFIGVNGTKNGASAANNSANNRRHNKSARQIMATQRHCDRDADRCSCRELGYKSDAHNSCSMEGWETSAPLHFGSVLQVGCQRFLFARVDHSGGSKEEQSVPALATDSQQQQVRTSTGSSTQTTTDPGSSSSSDDGAKSRHQRPVPPPDKDD